jgi:hypothetical protein
MKFYKPLELNGKTIDGLVYKENEELGILVPTNGVNAVFTPFFPLNQLFFNGDWYFALSGMGAYGTTYWTLIKLLVMPSVGKPLDYICFTPYTGNRIAFYWYCGGVAYLFYDCILTGDYQIRFNFASSGNALGVSFWNNYSWSYMANPFHNRTFIVSADDDLNPTVLTLTDTGSDRPTNIIKLYKEEILDPFNN